MDARETCPQIELACSDDVIALVLRHLQPMSLGDLAKLRTFAKQHEDVQWWLQPQGPQSIHLLDQDDARQLSYTLLEFGITFPFKPTDFTQVNPHINQVLVSLAVRLLALQSHERVIDWFCGLGNFTLPMATLAHQVLGVEGSEALVNRARQNYEANRALTQVHQALVATSFIARNLFEMTPEVLQKDGVADKWLVDPPRDGAFALIPRVRVLWNWFAHWPTFTRGPWVLVVKYPQQECLGGVCPNVLFMSVAIPRLWPGMPVCWCIRQATGASAQGL